MVVVSVNSNCLSIVVVHFPVRSAHAMKTVVYQSFRTERVPAWISACMATVKAWAAAQGFDYRFYDDAFLARAPEWFREKAQHAMCPVTDLARLIVAKELLAEGYERTVWGDADLLVFDPAALRIRLERGFQLVHEVWLHDDPAGAPRVIHRVNNSVAVFCAGSLHLDFFIDACARIGREREVIGKLDVGTNFLSHLRQVLPFPLLQNVGLLTPALMAEVAGQHAGQPTRLVPYLRAVPAPLAAVNLCGSFQGQALQGVVADDALFSAAIDRLLGSGGALLNDLRR